jgi:hypothetical protein
MTAEVHQEHAAEQAAVEGDRRRQNADRDENNEDGGTDQCGHQPARSCRLRPGPSNGRGPVRAIGDVCGTVERMR